MMCFVFRLKTAYDVRISDCSSDVCSSDLGRGLYDYPLQHDKLGALSPDPANVAKALSTQSGDKLAPSGAAAAHRLGLSTQVPARASYATTGRTRVRQAGGSSLTLKHSRADRTSVV